MDGALRNPGGPSSPRSPSADTWYMKNALAKLVTLAALAAGAYMIFALDCLATAVGL